MDGEGGDVQKDGAATGKWARSAEERSRRVPYSVWRGGEK